MSGALGWETTDSTKEIETVGTDLYGFARDSETYKAANDLNITIQELHSNDPQGDLFHIPIKRFELDYEKFYDNLPFRFGGEPIADESNEDGYAMPTAYDENDVMFECPRGICIISRTKWLEGWRNCPGC